MSDKKIKSGSIWKHRDTHAVVQVGTVAESDVTLGRVVVYKHLNVKGPDDIFWCGEDSFLTQFIPAEFKDAVHFAELVRAEEENIEVRNVFQQLLDRKIDAEVFMNDMKEILGKDRS